MQPVRKQILYGEHQRPVQDLIPFDDWKRIERQLGTSKAPNSGALMRFFGKINFPGDPVEIQRSMREELPE
jgi:hypothetical protein